MATNRRTSTRGASPRTPSGGKRDTAAGTNRGGARTSKTASAKRAPEMEPSRGGGGWSSLLRGPASALGQISGMDAPARAIERLSRSLERSAALLDHLDARIGTERTIALLDRGIESLERFDSDIGIDRAIALFARAESLIDLVQDMHRALLEMERLALDLRMRMSMPLDLATSEAMRARTEAVQATARTRRRSSR